MVSSAAGPVIGTSSAAGAASVMVFVRVGDRYFVSGRCRGAVCRGGGSYGQGVGDRYFVSGRCVVI